MKNFLTVLTAIALFGLIACEGPAGPAGAPGKDGVDGLKGLDGSSIEYKGEYVADTVAALKTPVKNWVYKNTTDKKVYLYTGTAWVVLVSDGANGTNGIDAGFVYFDGFKSDLKCGSCHNPDTDTTYFKAAATFQWGGSKHANGGTAFESGASCAECHTTEGFVQKMSGKPVTQKSNASPVGCFACHSPHQNGNFNLRQSAPVTLFSNLTGVADYSFDYGKGNLCAQCHRPRTQSVKLDPSKSTITALTDSIRITSGRWYSHYGVQSQMLMGKGGYEWANGPVAIENSFHTTSTLIKSDGCTICHMTTAVGDYTGGHSMKLSSEEEGENLNGCRTSGCHTSASLTKLDYKSAMTNTHANLDTLKVLLAQAGWLDTLAMQAKASSSAPLVIKPSNRAGALWNFFLVEHDLSSGVHNTAYANALLRNSIAKMRGQF